MTPRGLLLRSLYGTFFVVAVPLVLVLWASAAAAVVRLPAVRSAAAGLLLTLGGALLIASGWHALIVHGDGLPMNAFPPARYVRVGVYRWIRNPIYIGFALMSAGMSIAVGSASGLWLVTPTVSLAAAALVFGFERPDLVRRFGPNALEPPLLSIPRGSDEPPAIHHRLAVLIWILVPWLLTWVAAQLMGRPPDALETALPFERTWPVWQWTELIYVSAYLFVPMTVFTAASQRALRRFAISGAIAIVVITICWFTIPVVAANRRFVPTNVLGQLLALEQRSSAGVAAFPAFHVLWSMLAARVWGDDGRQHDQPARAFFGWGWAGLIAGSCLATGMHTVIEVAAALALFPIVAKPERWLAAIRAYPLTVAHAVIGAILLRLYVLGGSPALLIGIYLILSGIARFVAEAYRPPGSVWAGLGGSQWLGVVSVALGVWSTCLVY